MPKLSVLRTSVLVMEIVGADRLREWSLLDAGGCSDQELVNAVAAVVQAEGVLAGVRLRLVAEVDARELAEVLGTASTAGWLTSSGRVGAGVARRMVATAEALVELPHTAHELSVGEISEAHATAVVGAMGALDEACPGLPAAVRARAEARLVDTAMSGTPAAVGRCGQELLLRLAPPEMDATAAEDATRNRLDLGRTRNGRTLLRGDFDKETAEKLHTALSPLTNPRPGEDGTRDERPAAQRRADGFADILDVYLGCGASPTEGGVTPHVTLSATARDLAEHTDTGPIDLNDDADLNQPWPFQLAWMGPISGAAARMLACDCDLTRVVLNDDGVPLNLGRTERLVTPGLRRALVIRDQGCAFTGCGRPRRMVPGPSRDFLGRRRNHRPVKSDAAVPIPPPAHPQRTMGGIHRRRRAPLVHPTYRDRPPTKTAARLGTGGGARSMTNPTGPPARGCRAPSVATTGSGPLPPAGRAPTTLAWITRRGPARCAARRGQAAGPRPPADRSTGTFPRPGPSDR